MILVMPGRFDIVVEYKWDLNVINVAEGSTLTTCQLHSTKQVVKRGETKAQK
jgi:hypothetical protein